MITTDFMAIVLRYIVSLNPHRNLRAFIIIFYYYQHYLFKVNSIEVLSGKSLDLGHTATKGHNGDLKSKTWLLELLS